MTDAIDRRGVGVELRLVDTRDELRVALDPQTSDILARSEVFPRPQATAPAPPLGGNRAAPSSPAARLAERRQVFLSTGSVAAIGDQP